ncbi:MAG: Asp-tRNA(Asn)/Glu-tRNA(Gln) amidotransferase subunit GatB [Planctomycetes bacterium]|nr:Asp-tRNA(Asn)/Glu-tRNA(Gln) amidotransferase subunit GatB [Planctomycetota bacterium]
MTDEYDIVIGLEVHVQLKTESKLFCGCRNKFGCPPNENTCPLCLGMPGTLPVLNKQAFDYSLRTALAIGAKIAKRTKFDRKHYFYPDLPKGYQISQFDEPYCTGGGVEIELENGETKFIELTRIHMEEDAGKLSHAEDSGIADSIVDLNRAGTPLMEMVTEPIISSPDEAYRYLVELKHLLEYIEVSDCNMQEGSLRCDANISLKPKGAEKLGTKVEIKNMNSFKGVLAAMEHEVKRQYIALQNGETIVQETRLYDVDKGVTKSMRSKEQADDYRYFPDPDLPVYEVSDEWIENMRAQLCELPQARKIRFKDEYKLPDYDIKMLIDSKEIADYFEDCAKASKNYKEISNWIMGEISRELSERKVSISELDFSVEALAELIQLVDDKKISKKIAREEVFPEVLKSSESPLKVIERLGLQVESNDDVLIPIVKEAIANNPKAVEDFKNGKKKAVGAIIGFCMKATKGKADPGSISALVNKELEALL